MAGQKIDLKEEQLHLEVFKATLDFQKSSLKCLKQGWDSKIVRQVDNSEVKWSSGWLLNMIDQKEGIRFLTDFRLGRWGGFWCHI